MDNFAPFCYDYRMTEIPEIRLLKNLVAIAKNRTMLAASEELAVSPSALTRSMQLLEDELGVTLFDRAKNKISLNEVGLAAVGYAEKIIALSEEMRESLSLLERQSRAIVIGSVAPAPIWFLKENPSDDFDGRKIEFQILDETELLRQFEGGKFNRAIFSFAAESDARHSQSFSSRKICEERLFFSLPKSHRLAQKKSLSFSEMDGETFIVASGIGFWDDVHRRNLPSSRFIIQNSKSELEEITRKSTLPHFVTDLSLKYQKRPVEEKAVIPIRDKDAMQEFFLWERK